eukprot:TRINITY_DN275_c0_g2_i1.p1 TRINITY_DN275_c0_g2~~TRINITY_DN275_c0_g2_i1.p1  ORF type:complete len:361 (-),score=96.85 TRINITY_DN275_c0_g2_i1:2018-3001(-)
MAEEGTNKIARIRVEGLVALKIVKHCKESLPNLVAGNLLGLDVGDTLEVTNCFPFPIAGDAKEDVGLDTTGYQVETMRSMREVNVDNNTVGWYQSTYLGSWLSEQNIEDQYLYQSSIPTSVLFIYDPLRSSEGALALRAYRLTDRFMEVYKSGQFTTANFKANNVTPSDIYEEIPIELHNSMLGTVALAELEDPSTMDCSFDRLSFSRKPVLEKHLEFLQASLDELQQDQHKYQYYLRNVHRQQLYQNSLLNKRKQENAARKAAGQEPLPDDDLKNHSAFRTIPEPPRLDSYVQSLQVDLYANQINDYSALAFRKLFLANKVLNTKQ